MLQLLHGCFNYSKTCLIHKLAVLSDFYTHLTWRWTKSVEELGQNRIYILNAVSRMETDQKCQSVEERSN